MVLRFIGVMNAAVWFGTAVFYTFGVVPAFSSPEMKRLLSGDLYSGAAAHIVTHGYWAVYYWCGGVAIFHQLAEWVYLSRPLKSLVTYLLGMIFIIGLASGLLIQPKLEKLYAQKHTRSAPAPANADQLTFAEKSYSSWRTTTQVLNFLALAGLAVFTWQTIYSGNGTRFAPSKFRT
ncbi:MAG: hypothetical protein JWM16_4811 [Verrucomicrobiales bacterium]|nr:hypothetical protein [Verrucomicrobiales bacterium]